MPLTVSEGYARLGAHRTWYKITGDLQSGRLPLVLVHGGPGFTHDYLEAFSKLAESGRAVIHYDQSGNGRSSHASEQPSDFCTAAFFVDELENLLQHLDIASAYTLLGHSSGAIITAEHAVRQPAGLKGVVLANAYASAELFLAGIAALRAQLPQAVHMELDRQEGEGSAEAQSELAEFFTRHVCRVEPPPELQTSLAAMAANPRVFQHMHGPGLFQMDGALRSWSIIERLGRISAPALVYRGAHDEVSEAANEPWLRGLSHAQNHVFPNSSHLPHIEEPGPCLARVSEFLDQCDAAG